MNRFKKTNPIGWNLDLNLVVEKKQITPPKINMEHNNGGLEDDFPFQIGDF